MAHRMRLNAKKRKEMLINFMIKPNSTIRPIKLGDNAIERVPSYRILGVHLQEDLKWDIHVDYMHKKACKKLYSLRILRRAYVVPVWQSIPVSLSDKLESVQRHALKIIYPAESYNTVLRRAQIDSLSTKCHQLCVKYTNKIGLKGHPLHSLLPRQVGSNCPYGLRNMKDSAYLIRNCERCKTKRSQDFLMFKYFM